MRYIPKMLVQHPVSGLREIKYWFVYRPIQKLRPWLATKYPKWLVADALIHAIVRKTRDNEIMGEPSATDIYERWFKEGRRK